MRRNFKTTSGGPNSCPLELRHVRMNGVWVLALAVAEDPRVHGLDDDTLGSCPCVPRLVHVRGLHALLLVRIVQRVRGRVEQAGDRGGFDDVQVLSKTPLEALSSTSTASTTACDWAAGDGIGPWSCRRRRRRRRRRPRFFFQSPQRPARNSSSFRYHLSIEPEGDVARLVDSWTPA